MICYNRTVHLIDTPGFDDSKKTECETLQEIAYWLAIAYDGDIDLSGIVYLHRITDTRLSGTALRFLNMFKLMCGRENYSGIILSTTKWDEVTPSQRVVASQRQMELCENQNFWGDVKQAGGKVVAISAGRIDAMNIIRYIIQNDRKITLAFQRQLIEEQRQIAETDAGRILWESISDVDNQRIDDNIQRTVDEIEREIYRSQSKDNKTMKDIRARFGAVTDPFDEGVSSLKVGFQELRKIWDNRLQNDHEMFWREVARSKPGASEQTLSISDSENDLATGKGKPRPTYSHTTGQNMQTRGETLLAVRRQKSQRGRSSHLTAVSAIGTGLAAGQLVAAIACTVM